MGFVTHAMRYMLCQPCHYNFMEGETEQITREVSVLFSCVFFIFFFICDEGERSRKQSQKSTCHLLGRKDTILKNDSCLLWHFSHTFFPRKSPLYFLGSTVLLLSRKKQVLKSTSCSWLWWTGTSIFFFFHFSCLHPLINKTILHSNV